MKLRLGLLTDDLASRFQVSSTRVSQIFITWIKLLSRELSCLIIWPSRGQILKTLPHCYKKFYPKVRTITDCSEVFVETPSSLESSLYFGVNTKNTVPSSFWLPSHQTVLFPGCPLCMEGVPVTSILFYDILEPFDQVMADWGFKLKTDLAMNDSVLSEPRPTINMRPHIMHFRRLVFSYTE